MVKFHLLVLIAFTCYTCSDATLWNPYKKLMRGSASPPRPGESGEPLFLTPLLQDGKIEEARNKARVNHPMLSSVESYSGFMTVDAKHNSNLFFWYVPAKNNREQAPILVWLQGGPGASSLFGMFEENGPFHIHRNKSVKQREYSWHQNHHMIYIDNPVGTGFSFTDSDEGYSTNEEHVGENLMKFIQQFFVLFPNLLKHPFYISGESYGGKFVPAFGYAIHNSQSQPKINLQGLAIGDGYTDPLNQLNYGEYLYELGLIDLNGRKKFDEDTAAAIACAERKDMNSANRLIQGLFDGLDGQESYFKKVTGFSSYYNFIKGDEESKQDSVLMEFLSNPEVRKGIHVGELPFHDSDGHNKVAEMLSEDTLDTVAPWVSKLLSHYRVLFYNGQLDIICAYPMTVDFLMKMPFDGDSEYKRANREIYRVDGEIAGYKKRAGRLQEVLIRNAGHMVPRDQPKWAFDMITSFTHKNYL
nr:carboxypeptidase [Aedes aegypti]